jgi:hypothetical protein
MEIERSVFLATALVTLIYILFKKRQIDWFSVATASATVYFVPGFFGFVTDPDQRRFQDIEDATYLVFSFVYISIALGALWHDFVSLRNAKQQAVKALSVPNDQYSGITLLAISVISLVFAVIAGGDTFWVAEKEIAIETHGRWMIGYEFSACLGFLMCVASGARAMSVLAALLILPSVFFGYRTAVVMTLIGGVMMHLRGLGPTVLIRRWRILLSSFVAIYALIFLKQIQFALKYGLATDQWTLFSNIMESDEVYIDAVFNSEPFLVQNTLNEVVRTNFTVGIEHLESLGAIFVPLGNELGLSSMGFNDYFQPSLFADVDYGLASNIWAQAYALGGLGTVAVFCVLFVGLLTAINLAYSRSKGSVFAALALVGPYWSFYIHRNDLLFEFLLLRRVLFFFVISWAISYLFTIWRVSK